MTKRTPPPQVTLTANQNIILRDLEPAWRDDVQRALSAAGLAPVEELAPVDRFSMACPALPLCGLAITGAAARARDCVGVGLGYSCSPASRPPAKAAWHDGERRKRSFGAGRAPCEAPGRPTSTQKPGAVAPPARPAPSRPSQRRSAASPTSTSASPRSSPASASGPRS